jgi:inner membrane protein
MRFPVLMKVGALALVGGLVMGVVFRIEGLVSERRQRGIEAVQGVESSHAAAQALLGPLLARSCVEEWTSVSDTNGLRAEERHRRAFTLVASPATLAVTGRTQAEALHRGLFKVNAWSGHLAATARFANFDALRATTEHGGHLSCEPAQLLLALSDVRGVRSASAVADGAALDVHAGTSFEPFPNGLSAPLAAGRVEADGAAPLDVKLDLDLIGTRQLAWVPAAGNVRWSLASDWPHPSFGGQFLPDARTVRADGFEATWSLSALATTASADVARGLPLCASGLGDGGGDDEAAIARPGGCIDTMAVSFIDPVNPYVLSDRAVKYALLFVVLTFVSVALAEALSSRRVHPMQYLLVGLGLSMFFLLLLSLSEHLPFVAAYVVAVAACVLLLGFYASAMFGRVRSGAAFGAGVGLLYGLLYALLQMEQNALVLGSLGLFAALATVMMLTRRLDWDALFARLREPAATAMPDRGAP